jgi:hypothetical protein
VAVVVELVHQVLIVHQLTAGQEEMELLHQLLDQA